MLQHGGHEVYTINKLIEDYSVTTNFMGPSTVGLDNIKNNIISINHYPSTDKNYFKKGLEFLNTNSEHIIWGNGASELIDLSIRYLKSKSFSKGQDVQFMEYDRSCINNNMKLTSTNNSDILIIINPNNPTGTFLNKDELYEYIYINIHSNKTLIIDESMIFWLENWKEESSMFNTNLHKLLAKKECNLIVVHSWTKIFSCTGLRFGSIWSNNTNLIKNIEKYQTPWSVNILSYHYLNGCLNDHNYLLETRNKTSILRKQIYNKLFEIFPFITIYGKEFLSWLWIDLKSEHLVNIIHKKLFDNGILIRKGKIGYNQSTYIRIAVRNETMNNILFTLLKQVHEEIFKPIYSFKIDENIIYGIVSINSSYLLKHEEYISERKVNLQTYLNNNDYFILPSIIVCSKTLVIIDGHHRFEIYKEKNITEIPVLLINYDNENILTHDINPLDKSIIINKAIVYDYLPPKSTKHLIKDINNNIRPLISLSVLVDLPNYDISNKN
jgi:histidinol-phosphate/aromatic aminotransferase/cobyric acid decarboxylase-like protein